MWVVVPICKEEQKGMLCVVNPTITVAATIDVRAYQKKLVFWVLLAGQLPTPYGVIGANIGADCTFCCAISQNVLRATPC